MRFPEVGPLLRAALPVAAIGALVTFLALTLAVAGDTLGYDFLAYHQAAQRILDGQPLYDTSVESVGAFGLFFYPPAFLPFILPFGLLEADTATWLWLGLLLAAFLIGVSVLPVSRTIRWVIILLAGLSWPFAYGMKLGQVAPLLFLLFAIGWRWLDDPARSGASVAIGTAIKGQPGILLVWMVLTRRWRALVVAIVVLAGLSVIATLLSGPSAWVDFLTLLRQVNDPIGTVGNMTPGATLYRLGVPADMAGWVQLGSTLTVLVLIAVAALRTTAEASFLVTVIASQLLSPILWDHYGVLLLLPVAYLLSAGIAWAVLIPLATSTILVNVMPPITYPILFFVTLIATIVVGARRPSSIVATSQPSLA